MHAECLGRISLRRQKTVAPAPHPDQGEELDITFSGTVRA